MKNKINNLLTILCLILAVSAYSDEKLNDTRQSKPAGAADKNLDTHPLLQKYAPKACYKSIAAMITTSIDNNSIIHRSYAIPKAFKFVSTYSNGCIHHVLQYPDRRGYEWNEGNKAECTLDEGEMIIDPLFRSKLYCPDTWEKHKNIKLVTLDGKKVLYAEYPFAMGYISEQFYNLDPFYMKKEIIRLPSGAIESIAYYKDVKINEKINDDIFKEKEHQH